MKILEPDAYIEAISGQPKLYSGINYILTDRDVPLYSQDNVYDLAAEIKMLTEECKALREQLNEK